MIGSVVETRRRGNSHHVVVQMNDGSRMKRVYAHTPHGCEWCELRPSEIMQVNRHRPDERTRPPEARPHG